MSRVPELPLQSILIVDDDEADRFLAARAIRRAKLARTVLTVSDGQEALEFLQAFEQNRAEYGEAFPPELILLDINMPVMDGLAFLDAFAELREKDRPGGYEDLRVIVYSSSELLVDRTRATGHDFVAGYVTKPLLPAALRQLMDRILAP